MPSTTSAPRRELSADEVTVTTDKGGRPVVLLPDDIVAALNTSSRTDFRDYGIEGSESRHYAADSWEAHTVQTIYSAVTASPGVEERDKRGIECGYFYGAVIAHRHWNHETRWWADYDGQRHEMPITGLITRQRHPGHPEHMSVYFGGS
ncbi:hypothetical protein AQJ46_47895 [Streptomyces canus]|uniref:Uncharacterized protein n=1 Tax=Streptomyces canus TaxID=58343 RepID=A0A101RKN7_9ACTN|nr:hypothetical protein [Streptomyces canus]KUN57284.1 hypothetical protein AQJ46_47895 [Streptomyces canus]